MIRGFEPVTPCFRRLKDGLPLEMREEIVVEAEDGTFRLVIREAVLFDAGVYQCIISNSLGETSCTAALIVQGRYHSCHLMNPLDLTLQCK